MDKRTEIELEKFITLKVARAVIRLRHAVAAERELNEALPEVEERFFDAVNAGALPDAATAQRVVGEVLNA